MWPLAPIASPHDRARPGRRVRGTASPARRRPRPGHAPGPRPRSRASETRPRPHLPGARVPARSKPPGPTTGGNSGTERSDGTGPDLCGWSGGDRGCLPRAGWTPGRRSPPGPTGGPRREVPRDAAPPRARPARPASTSPRSGAVGPATGPPRTSAGTAALWMRPKPKGWRRSGGGVRAFEPGRGWRVAPPAFMGHNTRSNNAPAPTRAARSGRVRGGRDARQRPLARRHRGHGVHAHRQRAGKG